MPTPSEKLAIPTPQSRISKFEDLAFGLFLHWGLYSQLGQGEWIQHFKKIPVAEYQKLAETFTAADFDAAAIAKLARESGMRYIALTTRHHDGFSLYDTRGLSDFDAPHSAAGRDLIAEFVAACRAEEIVPFFYHTTLDWRWDTANCEPAKFDEYLDYLNASVEILCSHYGKIGGLWFDGNWSRPDADWKEDRLYATIRKHQPEAMIINNTGLSARGETGHPELDCTTFEQGLPTMPDRRGWPKYLAGEMSETMNRHWGIGARDLRFKGPVELIENLCACRKTGANYLLNVGPSASGAIPDYEKAVLSKLGEWNQITGRTLYTARPSGAKCSGKDFILKGEDAYYYYAHNLSQEGDPNVVVFGSENGARTIEALDAKITAAEWTDNGETLRFTQSPDNSLAALDCRGYDYGSDLVVRVAKLRVQN